uniref:Si:dkey-245n4.2 n=1 Tax=Cyprinus carpio TaxID=7962 RepID=A0A8C2HC05_CYPCA
MDAFRRGYCTFVLTTLVFQEVTGFLIRNEELRKCVQVNEGQVNSRLTLQECRADSALQEWHWNPKTRSLSNPQTGGCLTAPQIQEHESVWLQTCSSEEEDREGQTWSCSKKGLLTLHGRGLHLSVRHDSSKVFLSKDRGKASKWRTLANQTVCEETDSTHHGQNVLRDSQQTLSTGPRILTQIRYWHSGNNDQTSRLKSTDASQTSDASAEPQSSVEPDGPSVNVFTTDYGTGWKMTMLLLSSLALLLGLVILTLNIYQNRRKKTVVVLKSYTPTGEASLPGSPVSSERAPLTRHPMKTAQSPSIQRGEILVEWKDGTVTPLFETYLTD